jgi:hypothetical protein
VILLENSNEQNLPPAKEGSMKEREREEQGLENKRGETSFTKLHVSKKRMKILSKERKKVDHIFL